MTENNNTTALLNLSQTALTQALEELEEAKKTLEWAREKLAETQLDNRKLCNLLMKFSEAPDPKEFEALLKDLDKPCGFVDCQLTKQAASAIRNLSVRNEFLASENKKLRCS